MGTKDPRIDAYIEKSAAFARPILKKLRALIHKGCPEVVETIKWGAPSFDYKGMLCGMTALKQHCLFGFWKAALLHDGSNPFPPRITSVDDLPADAVLLALVKRAAKLNDEGVKLPANKSAKKPLPMPKEFAAALKKAKGAAAKFDELPPSHKREYIEWIIEAKTQPTRERRIATAVEWIGQGKSRYWKYQKR